MVVFGDVLFGVIIVLSIVCIFCVVVGLNICVLVIGWLGLVLKMVMGISLLLCVIVVYVWVSWNSDIDRL